MGISHKGENPPPEVVGSSSTSGVRLGKVVAVGVLVGGLVTVGSSVAVGGSAVGVSVAGGVTLSNSRSPTYKIEFKDLLFQLIRSVSDIP